MTCTSGSYNLFLDYLPENWTETSGGFPVKYEIQNLDYGQVATIRIPKISILSNVPINRPVGCTLQWINGEGPIVPPEKHEIWFSYCPGNFSEYPDGNEQIYDGIRCYKSIDVTENVSTLKWYYATEGWDQSTILNPGVTDTPVIKSGACIVDPNKDLYINIRWDNITENAAPAGGNVYTYWISGALSTQTKSAVESSVEPEYVIDESDQFAANVKLLLVFDGSEGSNNVIDYSIINKTPEVNENVQITAVQTKFGTGSGVAKNDVPRLIYPISQDFKTTSDWTLDFFIYIRSDGPNGLSSVGNGQRFLSITDTRFFQLKLGDDSIPHLYCTWLGDSGAQMGDSVKGIAGDLEYNKWYHIALVHTNLGGDDLGRTGRWSCYKDGIAQYTGSIDAFPGDGGPLAIYESLVPFSVFTLYESPLPVSPALGFTDGYLDEVRFTRSIRYTNTFTPPTRSAVRQKPTEENPEDPEKPVTSTIFERLGYNYNGPGIYDFSDKVIKVIETVPSLVPEWAYEDLRTNNVGDYIQNPVGDLANNIMVVLNTTKNRATSLGLTSVFEAANNAYTNTVLFLEHTNRLSGLVEPDSNTANLPHYETAISTGQLMTYLVYQGDGYANSAVVMGNFTSILGKEDLQKLYDDVASFPLTELNVSEVTLRINNLNNYLYQRVKHDEGFYSNSKVVIEEFQQLKEFTRMGSNETNLIHNYLASDKLKERGYLPYTPNPGEEPPIVDRPGRPPICSPGGGEPPPPPPPGPSCSGFGSPTHKATGGQVFINQMQKEQIVSIEFSSAFFGSDGMKGTALGLSVAGDSADIQCVVSRCPNDFTSIGPQCSFIRRGTQGTWEFFLSDTPNTSRCTLPRNTSKVYVNIRQVKIPAAGVSAPAYNAPFCSTSSSTSCWLPSCPPGENCSFDVNASPQTGVE